MPVWFFVGWVGWIVAAPVDDISRALETASEARRRALVELAACLEVPPEVWGPHAAEVRSARDRLGGTASWRVRVEAGVIEVELIDPSGRLDRIRAWYVTPESEERVHGAGQGARRRFPTPRGWPGAGALLLQASSSLLPSAPTLLSHQVEPARDVPAAPNPAFDLSRPEADVPGSPPSEAWASAPPWWLWAAGVVAVGAVGFGVWQETR